MRSVMTHQFSQVPAAQIPRSSFDRTSGYKTTFDSGYIVPVFVDEVLPGDTFRLSMTNFSRLSTPLHPYMDNAFLTSFFFFVPTRLIWDNWQRFNGEQRNPGDSTDFLIPQVVAPAGGAVVGSMWDYFGLPTQCAGLSVSALPFRAYNLIYNEWFRDENLQNSLVNHVDDGPDPYVDYVLQRRGKRHDYFTSCLPWPQKGASVTIPLGSQANVITSATEHTLANQAGLLMRVTSNNSQPTANTVLGFGAGGQVATLNGTAGASVSSLYPTNLVTDLSTATASTINQLRQAFQVQKLYERDARGGTRYTELVRSHFGVVSPDARLQRPEYLGGGRSPINLHAVPQSSPSGIPGSSGSELTPQANLAAYGTTTSSGHGFSKAFTEHGYVLGFVCVTADLTYQSGIERMWSRRGRFDFYWPALSHIGEQAVLSQEIWADGTAGDQTVFGYQERYAEYRYKPSKITGQMRSNFAQSLDTWHLSQDFSARPLLNPAFITENPPFARVVAVPSEPQFIGDFLFQLRCARPMPVYGVPGLIDHF